jgi:DNA polymerase III epsilon subunit-like protein
MNTPTEQLLPPIHVMVDIETLGTKPGCKILSIGACKFQLEFGDLVCTFEQAIDPINQALMDEPDPSTLAWWNEQAEEARNATFNNPNARNIVTALTRFNDWLAALRQPSDRKMYIWGNGATFDEPIILEACKRYGIKVEWTFRDAMCFRTLKEIGKMYGIKEPEFVGVKHSALHDAMHQASWADKILYWLEVSP